MASNPCKRRHTDLNGDKKREICVYKDAHPKATCSDIAAHIAKEWDVTVGRTAVGDISRSKEKWSAPVEQQNMASLKKHLCCGGLILTHIVHPSCTRHYLHHI